MKHVHIVNITKRFKFTLLIRQSPENGPFQDHAKSPIHGNAVNKMFTEMLLIKNRC